MLRLDFYESGIGETTIITFPEGGIGIVDAHPSPTSSRSSISELTCGKTIHFACLTHPHADHGRDLVEVVKNAKPAVLWHTIPNFKEFIYRAFETQQFFPSPNREFVEKYHREWAEIFADIFGTAQERGISRRQLRADVQPETIDGVEVHFLSPEEAITQTAIEKYAKEIQKAEPSGGDPNLLSAIIALRYGDSVVLLGADALKRNWETATQRFWKVKLPKAILLKVPHHGASNALDLRKDASHHGYLDICSGTPRAFSVIFGGDSKHPEKRVYERLCQRTNPACLSNGLRTSHAGIALGSRMPGARRVTSAAVCHPVLSFEIGRHADLHQIAGGDCSNCPNTPWPNRDECAVDFNK